MKGIANTLELIGVMIALFVSFNFFFPGSSYRNNWENAYAVLLSRDMLASLVATDDIQSYMSDRITMENFFSNLFPQSNYIFWSSTEGIKKEINVSCACSLQQIVKLESWSNGLEINGQQISMKLCQADLSDPSSTCMEQSDVLIIWNDEDLAPHLTTLYNYLVEDKGIIEIRDFTQRPGITQRTIFGIDSGGVRSGTADEILEPSNVRQLSYQPYKLFYHMPLSLFATEDSDVPDSCTVSRKGIFTIKGSQHGFWVCDGSSVYFSSSGTVNPDIGPLRPRQGSEPGDEFTLEGSRFELSYIDSQNKIRITFLYEPGYSFENFAMADDIGILPDDGDESRIFMRMNGPADNRACSVVLNNVSDSRTAWVADFSRDGLDSPTIGDDYRQLLLSLIVWASKKQESTEPVIVKSGYTTSYISVNNTDVFEIRRYEIGVGYPY